ncbi:hypothetical protein DITRI_Ditri07aG0136300 [Diplodiscus trichospermus]
MDVFIPEEYVVRRRMEKKAAAIAGRRPNMVAGHASKKMEKEMKKSQLPPPFRLDSNEQFLFPGGINENLLLLLSLVALPAAVVALVVGLVELGSLVESINFTGAWVE